MHALRAWGDKWAISEPPLRAGHHGHPIRPYVACATFGEPVCEGDLEFISTASRAAAVRVATPILDSTEETW
jgi:hypothetical protein